uniref:Uncharacterized protein n=1 Tax=Glossina brevipalpis TaxID=37001 RepID=A0A1A9WXM3_9MUSC
MKVWILVLIALGAMTVIDAQLQPQRPKVTDEVILLFRKRACLQEEDLPENTIPGHDTLNVLSSMLQLEQELVPYGAKCFLRCWLKKIDILSSGFIINKPGKKQDIECQNSGRAMAKDNECEFAFAYLKCDHTIDLGDSRYVSVTNYK